MSRMSLEGGFDEYFPTPEKEILQEQCSCCEAVMDSDKLHRPVAYKYFFSHYAPCRFGCCDLCLEEFESGRNPIYKTISFVREYVLSKSEGK